MIPDLQSHLGSLGYQMSPNYVEVFVGFAGAALYGVYMLILVGLLIGRQKKKLQGSRRTHVLQRKVGADLVPTDPKFASQVSHKLINFIILASILD